MHGLVVTEWYYAVAKYLALVSCVGDPNRAQHASKAATATALNRDRCSPIYIQGKASAAQLGSRLLGNCLQDLQLYLHI